MILMMIMNVLHQFFRVGEYEFDMADKKLGLIGGFGGYAALDSFRRILEKFQIDTERSYPHIIIWITIISHVILEKYYGKTTKIEWKNC